MFLDLRFVQKLFQMCHSRKYPYPSRRGFFGFQAPPLWKLQFCFILLKILAFETPLPLGISNNPPRGGYGYFLELHNAFKMAGFTMTSYLTWCSSFGCQMLICITQSAPSKIITACFNNMRTV